MFLIIAYLVVFSVNLMWISLNRCYNNRPNANHGVACLSVWLRSPPRQLRTVRQRIKTDHQGSCHQPPPRLDLRDDDVRRATLKGEAHALTSAQRGYTLFAIPPIAAQWHPLYCDILELQATCAPPFSHTQVTLGLFSN